MDTATVTLPDCPVCGEFHIDGLCPHIPAGVTGCEVCGSTVSGEMFPVPNLLGGRALLLPMYMWPTRAVNGQRLILCGDCTRDIKPGI